MKTKWRNWDMTEHDDYARNVEPLLDPHDVTVPIIWDGLVAGWRIQPDYE